MTATWEEQLRELVHARGQALVRYAFVLVAVVATGSALVVPGSGRSSGADGTGAPTTPRPGTSVVSPAMRGTLTPSPSRPAFVNPTLRLPPPAGSSAPPRNLPPGLGQVCGKPGSRLTVRILPVVIPYHMCDVRGVDVVVSGMNVTVPTTLGYGNRVEASRATPAASGQQWLQAETGKSGDVTITGR